MSASKKDRTTAPRLGTRPSRAKHIDDRNVKPPAGYRRPGKPKPGARAMEAQLAARAADCYCGHAYETHDLEDACSECDCRAWSPADNPSPARDPVVGTIASSSTADLPAGDAGATSHEQLSIVAADPDDQAPPRDPWWTDERERAFAMALQGVPQHQIAAELGRDRHTVGRWADDERFLERLHDENVSRFKASRQRRSVQTVRITDKAERLAGKLLDKALSLAEKGEDQLGVRLAALDWSRLFHDSSRREDEIFGLDKQRVDVNVHGQVQHQHRGKVDVSFKAFLATSLQAVGVDVAAEEVDSSRADEALVAVTERALTEGSFLDDLVKRENAERLEAAATRGGR